ncbi:Dolichyl-diphosphooligosaccharide-protein glycosyltransferase subunit dad1 [Entomophthora muscae]|uniref:Dolichyl-diphosphooligosaccharide-protein glycosyltransferase subunit dad1 n=2 Tax=Entomophthora muscae TaxID=34485 RepID=A0ACC2T4K2_9FUNG|nr:Dolichyl-diphosphooligosaccharide-protein glycosyltransferase subunit dad1 [Entomophthora muscae]KAJ9090489.1 Dolichyl-diphosphooligosaccharide-protein glycosyltransferase subunit dad1 [Entomophthora muscae]
MRICKRERITFRKEREALLVEIERELDQAIVGLALLNRNAEQVEGLSREFIQVSGSWSYFMSEIVKSNSHASSAQNILFKLSRDQLSSQENILD